MSNILLKPYDSVDLALLIESYGESIGTLYPQAIVYGPDNVEITGSPFTLVSVGNNYYSLKNAFQAAVDSGQYSVIYVVYTDAGHTARSSAFGEKIDTITISIQAVSGSVGGSAGGFYDDEQLRRAIKAEFDKINDRIKKLQKDFDAGLKVEIPKNQFDMEFSKTEHSIKDLRDLISLKSNDNINKQIMIMQSSLKNKSEDIINAVKKNRSVIIKSKFDKSQMLPIIETVANTEIKLNKLFSGLKIDITKTIDYKNDEMTNKFSKILEGFGGSVSEAMNKLNESIRIKLKFTLEGLKMLVLGGKQNKQNINITLKKDE
ncbi:MAG: hypothetical protein WCW93_03780 [Candidatus Paceibacterota bacterium]|jgi:hypothetical protein